MGYLHITNLYRPEARKLIDLFKEVYALEKVHGTSASLTWHEGTINYHHGGASAAAFNRLFDDAALKATFTAIGHPHVVVYGEAYGGAMQKMAATYGPTLQFIAFDVMIGDTWLDVPNAAAVALRLGLEFVPFVKGPCTVEFLDNQRDRPSDVAVRRGIDVAKPREGIVIRPLVELTTSSGERVIAKHKGDAFAERVTPPQIADAARLTVLADAERIANEWCTPMRLQHVLDKLPEIRDARDMRHTPTVIKAMIEDIHREATGEIVISKEADAAIGKLAAKWFKAHVTKL